MSLADAVLVGMVGWALTEVLPPLPYFRMRPRASRSDKELPRSPNPDELSDYRLGRRSAHLYHTLSSSKMILFSHIRNNPRLKRRGKSVQIFRYKKHRWFF